MYTSLLLPVYLPRADRANLPGLSQYIYTILYRAKNFTRAQLLMLVHTFTVSGFLTTTDYKEEEGIVGEVPAEGAWPPALSLGL